MRRGACQKRYKIGDKPLKAFWIEYFHSLTRKRISKCFCTDTWGAVKIYKSFNQLGLAADRLLPAIEEEDIMGMHRITKRGVVQHVWY